VIIRSIDEWIISMCSCSLTKAKQINIPNENVYVKIEIFDSLNYFDNSIIVIMLLKIDTVIFQTTQNSN